MSSFCLICSVFVFFVLFKMNEDRQMELHYLDGGGFPYTVTESFMDFFEGLHQHQVPAYANAVPLLDQVTKRQSMKFFDEL